MHEAFSVYLLYVGELTSKGYLQRQIQYEQGRLEQGMVHLVASYNTSMRFVSDFYKHDARGQSV